MDRKFLDFVDQQLRNAFPEMVANAVEDDDGFVSDLIPALGGLSSTLIASIFAEIAAEYTGDDFDRLSGLRPREAEAHPAVVIANRVNELGIH